MKRLPLIDLHEDIAFYILTHPYFKNFDVKDQNRYADIPSYKEANVRMVVSVVFPMLYSMDNRKLKIVNRLYKKEYFQETLVLPETSYSLAIKMIKLYHNLVKKYSDDLKLIITKSDIENLFKEDKVGFLLNIEGSEALQTANDLEIFFLLGLRMIGLTWNYDTKYAASCMSKKDYGLTGSGEELIEIANEKGVAIDLAHASPNTMVETLELSRLPVVISHANYFSVRPHIRNVVDKVLERLASNKGVIGFTLIKSTISEGDYINSLVNHIMEVYEVYGSDIIAIGTDFFGTDPPEELNHITKVGSLGEKLLERGMDEKDIKKLFWKNAYRVILQNAVKWDI